MAPFESTLLDFGINSLFFTTAGHHSDAVWNCRDLIFSVTHTGTSLLLILQLQCNVKPKLPHFIMFLRHFVNQPKKEKQLKKTASKLSGRDGSDIKSVIKTMCQSCSHQQEIFKINANKMLFLQTFYSFSVDLSPNGPCNCGLRLMV